MCPIIISSGTLISSISGHFLQLTKKGMYESHKDYRAAVICVNTHSPNYSIAYISDVLRVREVGQVSVVELLTFQVVAVLARLQIAGFDAVGLKELLVSHSKSLTDSLGDDLSLDGEEKTQVSTLLLHSLLLVEPLLNKYSAFCFALYFHMNKFKQMSSFANIQTSKQV